MRIHGVVCWFQESPSWLAAMAASAARLVDHLVVVDGRYALFGHELPVSPTLEAETLIETCEGAGVAMTMYRPSEPYWGNEVEKRNLSVRLAMVSATQMEDWVVVLDGDQYIRHVNKVAVRNQLKLTDKHVAELVVEEYMDPHNPDQPLDIARHRFLGSVHHTYVRQMYRCLPNLGYEGAHYCVHGDVDGVKTWLWGHPEMVEAERIEDHLIVRHRNILRTAERRQQAAFYYEQRDRLRIEVPPNEVGEPISTV